MASGDTHVGEIRVTREDAEGNELRVMGPIEQDRVDYVNNNLDAVEKLYINTALTARRTKPSGAEGATVPDAQWGPAEILRVKHKADATVTNDIDVNAGGAFQIQGLLTDLNRGAVFPTTLRAPDNEVSADPAESDSQYVTFFEYTVGDRRKFNLAGVFGAVAVEN